MPGCVHEWEMTNVTFGFVVFERCSHCQGVRTFFSLDENTSDEYRDGPCTYITVENAQSIRFDVRCRKCGVVEGFSDLMGLLYCTECMAECAVMRLQQQAAAEKTMLLVAFGYLPEAKAKPFPAQRLGVLTDYFNQRRDVARSRVRIVPFHLIESISHCRGEFIHDVKMLSPEAGETRKPLL